MQKTIEIHLPHYEILQLSPHWYACKILVSMGDVGEVSETVDASAYGFLQLCSHFQQFS